MAVRRSGRACTALLTAMLCVILMTGGALPVQAAKKTMPDGTVFDPEFYAASYPDVAAAVGTDESALYQHYRMFGYAEGRLAYAGDPDAAAHRAAAAAGSGASAAGTGAAGSGVTPGTVSTVVNGTAITGVDGSQIPNAGRMLPSFSLLINVNGNPDLVCSNGRILDLTKPMVALTYDDGPKSANGNHIMDVLEQYNGRATFFVVGNNVKANASEVQRMAADGMEIGNHSYDHRYYNKLSAAEITQEIDRCNSAVQEAAGVTPVLARLPGGNVTKTVRSTVSLPMIYWTNDTRDWETKSTEKTIDRVVGHVKDGDIVLMHEIHSSTVKAQDTIIPELTAQGYQLVTVSELAYFHNYGLTTGIQYHQFPVK